MKHILLTGMSATGKSSVIRELAARGYKAIDADDDGWSHWVNMKTGRPAPAPETGEYGWDELDWVWHEARVLEHLETVEPLLRKAAHHEIDTSAPLDEVVERILSLAGVGPG
jgi:adenylate kinase family enzyme